MLDSFVLITRLIAALVDVERAIFYFFYRHISSKRKRQKKKMAKSTWRIYEEVGLFKCAMLATS